MASSTPSTRAIVVRGALSYTLSATDADVVFALPCGRHILLGSEAVARSAAALARFGVTSVVNCAYNSEPLPPGDLTAAGVAHFARLLFRDEAAAPGQDAQRISLSRPAATPPRPPPKPESSLSTDFLLVWHHDFSVVS
jgi:hypothetical protein